MIRILLVITALVSIFMFPWPLSALLSFAAALTLPAAALGYGILYDVLYFPGGGWPLGTVLGLIGTGLAFFVRRFVKARIMGA